MSVRIVQTKHGAILARQTDTYIGASLCYYGEYSSGECRWFGEVLRPGDVAVDVGANIGALTAVMASLVGAKGLVYAFEPQRLPFQMLCGSLALNDRRNVLAVNAPVGSCSGVRITIPELDMDGKSNVGGMSLVEPHESGIPLATVAIDDYNLPACRLLKVDVEGMEPAVLEGAKRTIAKYLPVLHVEANSAPEAYALRDRIVPLGYRCFMQFTPLYNPNNYRGHKPNIWGMTNQSQNLIGIPPWWTDPIPPKFRPVVDESYQTLFLERRA